MKKLVIVSFIVLSIHLLFATYALPQGNGDYYEVLSIDSIDNHYIIIAENDGRKEKILSSVSGDCIIDSSLPKIQVGNKYKFKLCSFTLPVFGNARMMSSFAITVVLEDGFSITSPDSSGYSIWYTPNLKGLFYDANDTIATDTIKLSSPTPRVSFPPVVVDSVEEQGN